MRTGRPADRAPTSAPPSRCSGLALLLGVAAAGLSGCGDDASADPHERGSDSPTAAGTGSPAGAGTGRGVADDSLAARLKAFRAELAAVEWPATTPAEIGAALGHDPQALLGFARTALRFEPYAGIQRGPRATLAAGGGNSADLALLLRAMLADARPAPRTRFAIAQLSDADLETLLDRAAAAPPARTAMAPGTGAAPTYPAELAATVSAAADGNLKERASELGLLRERVETDEEQVGPLLPARPGDDRKRARAAAREHVWLQVEVDGRWESLDPAADLALPSEGVRTLDALPADWHHRVRLTLEAERLDAGQLQRQRLVEGEWTTEEIEGRAIELSLVPTALSIDALLEGSADRATFLEQARSFDKFAVLLGLSGAEPERGQDFDLAGEVLAASQGPLAFDPFGAAKRATGQVTGQLSAIWLTVEIQGPEETERVERALLDRIGAGARAAGRTQLHPEWQDSLGVQVGLVQRHQILVPVGRIGLVRLAREALTSIADRPVLEEAVRMWSGEQAASSDALAELGLPVLPGTLIRLNDNALALAEAEMAGAGTVFLSRPNLYIRSESTRLEGAADVRIRTEIDVALNRVGTLGDPDPGARARLRHGLYVSELEGIALGRGGGESRSAANLLRRAAEQGVRLARLESGEDLTRAEASEDARAVMAAELAAGYTLLAPERPIRVDGRDETAWWRIDEAGNVLAVGADGRGQGTSEGVMVLKHISIPMVKRTMKFVYCFNLAVAGGTSMQQAGAECMPAVVVDIVKSALDNAISTFVVGPLTAPYDDLRAEALGARYEDLYQQAKAAKDAYNQARSTVDSGIAAGNAAARAGREIGATLGFRIYLLLTMGRDIAAYASELQSAGG